MPAFIDTDVSRTTPRTKPNRKPPPTWVAPRRAASRARCRRCRGPLLIGPDHDRCAYIAKVDAKPVDPQTELTAIITGRASFNLIGAELHYRAPHHHPGTPSQYPVHLEHRCAA